jgi:antitoxin component of MazEF toxin-antitoxin module
MITYTKYIGTKGNALATSIPTEILTAMGLDKGDPIKLSYNDQNQTITITKA